MAALMLTAVFQLVSLARYRSHNLHSVKFCHTAGSAGTRVVALFAPTIGASRVL